MAGLVCMGTWDNENAVMENYACVGVRLPHLPVPLGLALFHFCVRSVWQTQNKKKQRSAWHKLLPGTPFSTRHSAMQKGGGGGGRAPRCGPVMPLHRRDEDEREACGRCMAEDTVTTSGHVGDGEHGDLESTNHLC